MFGALSDIVVFGANHALKIDELRLLSLVLRLPLLHTKRYCLRDIVSSTSYESINQGPDNLIRSRAPPAFCPTIILVHVSSIVHMYDLHLHMEQVASKAIKKLS